MLIQFVIFVLCSTVNLLFTHGWLIVTVYGFRSITRT